MGGILPMRGVDDEKQGGQDEEDQGGPLGGALDGGGSGGVRGFHWG
jgi:hypothetical protein